MQFTPLRKDQSLDRLAERFNVAQFVSYAPGDALIQQYARIVGYAPNHNFSDARSAIGALLASSPESSVNVRSFTPEHPRSNEFIYGLRSVDDAYAAAMRLARSGLYVIVNETVDVHDGGVSGVIQGGAVEFAPDDTPRCVEKPGVASLPRDVGLRLLQTVYGFDVQVDIGNDARLEFSLHPRRRGWRQSHLLGWEFEHVNDEQLEPSWQWPNRFSRLIGDKVFGLLVASHIGLLVPATTVLSRRVAPFSFGKSTTSGEMWIRTAPFEQVAGKFTTRHGWTDPFRLLAEEDPDGTKIASVLAQRDVGAAYSGALISTAAPTPIIEGRRGSGEGFMQGTDLPEQLPAKIRGDVARVYRRAMKRLGPVRLEWVHDGSRVWVVQLHRGATNSAGNVVVPGDAKEWRNFEVTRGLKELRNELESLNGEEGIILRGHVGLTSHIADVLRKAGHPARISL